MNRLKRKKLQVFTKRMNLNDELTALKRGGGYWASKKLMSYSVCIKDTCYIHYNMLCKGGAKNALFSTKFFWFSLIVLYHCILFIIIVVILKHN